MLLKFIIVAYLNYLGEFMASTQTVRESRFRNTFRLSRFFAFVGCLVGTIMQSSVGLIALVHGETQFAGPVLMAMPLMALICALPSSLIGALTGFALDYRKKYHRA